MNFDIKTEQLADDSYVISLAGEVDLYTAPEFKQQLLEVIAQGGKSVIVDFSDTTFIDSTTLGVLVGGVKRLRTNERAALARLQRPQHHEDLRDHRPRPRVHDLRHARRGRRPGHGDSARRRRSRMRACAAGGRAARAAGSASPRSAAAPRGTVENAVSRQRQGALQARAAASATRSPTPARRAGSGPNLDDAFANLRSDKPARVSTRPRSATSSAARSRTPSRTRRPASRACRPNIVDGRRGRRGRELRRVGRGSARRSGGRRRTARSSRHRRSGDLHAGRVRRRATRSPTANANGTIGPNLDDTKPAKALAIERVDERAGCDAVLQGPARARPRSRRSPSSSLRTPASSPLSRGRRAPR